MQLGETKTNFWGAVGEWHDPWHKRTTLLGTLLECNDKWVQKKTGKSKLHSAMLGNISRNILRKFEVFEEFTNTSKDLRK